MALLPVSRNNTPVILYMRFHRGLGRWAGGAAKGKSEDSTNIINWLAKHRSGAANRFRSHWRGHDVIAMLNGKVEWCGLIMFG